MDTGTEADDEADDESNGDEGGTGGEGGRRGQGANGRGHGSARRTGGVKRQKTAVQVAAAGRKLPRVKLPQNSDVATVEAVDMAVGATVTRSGRQVKRSVKASM